MEYYEEGEYYKASVLLEDILPIIKGSKKAEKAQFFFAYSYYHQGQYTLGAFYFKNFYQTYSRSDFAQEAMFMHAYSLYLESPAPGLDQTSTYEAVQAMQSFLNRYPSSEFRQQATAIIDELQEKLERKAFRGARQYHKLERYKAALVALDNFKKDFPDSDFVEEASFLEIDTQFQLAVRSILSKKKERFRNTITRYEEFVDRYPESEFLSEAQQLYDQARQQLGKLSNNETLQSLESVN